MKYLEIPSLLSIVYTNVNKTVANLQLFLYLKREYDVLYICIWQVSSSVV